MNSNFLVLEGNTNDLLMVDTLPSCSLKSTRLIRLDNSPILENMDPDEQEKREEIIDVAITSSNARSEHPLFDKLLDKRIRVTIDIVND